MQDSRDTRSTVTQKIHFRTDKANDLLLNSFQLLPTKQIKTLLCHVLVPLHT